MVKASASKKGMAMIPLSAEVLADTALDLIQNSELFRRMKEEHRYNVAHQKEGKLFGINREPIRLSGSEFSLIRTCRQEAGRGIKGYQPPCMKHGFSFHDSFCSADQKYLLRPCLSN